MFATSYFRKDDFVAMNLFLPYYIKTASASRHGSADAETTPNPAHKVGKTALRFTLLCKVGFGVVVIVLRFMWYYKGMVYFNFVWRYRVVYL